MDASDREEFRAIIEHLWLIYQRKGKPEPAQVASYWEALKIYAIADIRAALNAHYVNPDNGQFLPKPADVVRLIQGDSQSQAALATTKVDKALRCHGPYRNVCFDDPIIHQVVFDMGGWVHFCTRSNDDDYVFQLKEFERRYQSYVSRPPADYPRLLTGIASHSNGIHGYGCKEPPVLIGNPEKAEQTYLGGVNPALQDNRQRNRIAAMIMQAEQPTVHPALEDKALESKGIV